MLTQLLGLTRPLIIFDLETTTNKPETARIVQLGFRLHKPDGSVTEYHTLVDPMVEIPKASSDVHGITDETIQRGCSRCRQYANVHPNGENCDAWRAIPTFKDIGPRIAQGFTGYDLAG